jgi:DNA repair protein RecO (recombination protein O)
VARLSRDQGIVLRTQDHAETDRIAILLTPHHGRIDILAKGARRMEQASGAVLEALNVVEAIFYQRTGLKLLRETSLTRTFPKVRADFGRLSAALWGMNWALALVPSGVPNERAFRLTLSFLAALEGGLPPEMRLAYAVRLLAAEGHRPHLAGCVVCGAEEGLTWSPDRGGFLCQRCGGRGVALSPRLPRIMEALGRLPFSALGRLRTDEETLAQIEELLVAFREVQLRR